MTQRTTSQLLAPGLFICPGYDERHDHDLSSFDPSVSFYTVVYRKEDLETGLDQDELGSRIRAFLLHEAVKLDLESAELVSPDESRRDIHRPEIELPHQDFTLTLKRPNDPLRAEVDALKGYREARKRNRLRERYGRTPLDVKRSRLSGLEGARLHPEPEELRFLVGNSEAVVVWSLTGGGTWGLSCWVVQRGRGIVQELPFFCASIGVDCVVRPPGSTMPAW